MILPSMILPSVPYLCVLCVPAPRLCGFISIRVYQCSSVVEILGCGSAALRPPRLNPLKAVAQICDSSHDLAINDFAFCFTR